MISRVRHPAPRYGIRTAPYMSLPLYNPTYSSSTSQHIRCLAVNMQRLQLILSVLLLSFGVQPCGDSDTKRQEPAILPASPKPQPLSLKLTYIDVASERERYSDGDLPYDVPQNDFRKLKGENASMDQRENRPE